MICDFILTFICDFCALLTCDFICHFYLRLYKSGRGNSPPTNQILLAKVKT
ncbi:hypothetical protein HMPREF1574_01086 [Gardnerella pickettii JCP7659]|nr:hypothetical protein HMPREF1583_00465 [Gardnerella vaginalis JCP8151B]EPI48453.1 hypothetical protein HMPREF1582_00194 [Gardnerella vaginalis JCP8151A]EPI54595.1 hypothetical protein HMPREF1574_01086 [Gardnerella pickettii JCP7659]EPI60811.1 hypothetical protein HMPREF1580_00200 [Gardnerella vaginalis JCP8070]